MTYSIEKVATLIGARRYGRTDTTIGFLLTDSRSLCFPEATLFFAIRTDRGDGHAYLPDLYRRGVRNFVVDSVPTDWEVRYPDANFLRVANTLVALQRLAERHRDRYNIPIIAITGSNGKTMVKEWLYQLLSPYFRVTRSPRSYNSQTGVPLSLWLMDESTEVALIEAGISLPGEMQHLADIIRPTWTVLTNVGEAHQENFASLEEKCREKLRLAYQVSAISFDADDALVAKVEAEERQSHGDRLFWSRRDSSAPFFVQSIDKGTTITTVSYTFHKQPGVAPLQGQFTLPFIDDASTACALPCAVVALGLGLTPEQLSEGMARLEPVAMRLEVKEGRHGCTLINDSYNSDVNSLNIALDFMYRRPDHHGRSRTLILSDILQSGQPAEKLYTEVSRLLRQRGVDKFVGIGPELCQQHALFEVAQQHFFPTVDDFLRSPIFASLNNEVILIKGARQYGFDRITELLVRKVHETVLEVNLNALVDNLNRYRSLMRPTTRLVCMIKADAYGAGSVEVAKTLQDHRVDYLAVAVADEGVTLRRNGITANIMVMNPEMSAFKTIFDYELEPEVYSFRLLDALIHAAEKEGITDYPVHIKLDTGMHRLGFDPEQDMEALIARLKGQSAFKPRSVFSHFVGSDSDAFDDFSTLQFDRFDRASKQLQQAFSHHILRHIDNSAGIEHFPERQLDMCRLGLGLYGINPRDNSLLHTVSTLRTTILQMRKVKASETVGYSRKGTLQRDSVIAAIPIGYADGLDRHLGNRHAYCLVNGQRADYVGNICMDVAMIDVTGIDCQEGDEVEIFGTHLPVTVLSNALQTIPYEVLTGISPRVKRVYYQD